MYRYRAKFIYSNKENIRTRRLTIISEEFRIQIDASKNNLGDVIIYNGKSISLYLHKLTLS